MWTIHNEVTGRTIKNNEFCVNGDPSELANQYNKYILSIVPELISNLNTKPFKCSISPNCESMYMTPVNVEEICELGKQIKNKYSSGIDEIPACLVKAIIPTICEILCFLINNSFKYGIFPNQLKMAVIKPIYKKGDSDLMENYRPISILPSFSKIFELAMSRRLLGFFNKCKLLNPHQHGYISDKSTQTAIFQFIKAILRHLEASNLVLGFCLDLSKAYDCIDAELLIEKLELYGVRGNASKLFASYLSDRQQKVKITKNGSTFMSETLYNGLGIAQGSILGPILFIIFVNDLFSIANCQTENITCYADDTNLTVGGKNLNDVVSKGNTIINKASDWFTENKLILNKKKTNIIMF